VITHKTQEKQGTTKQTAGAFKSLILPFQAFLPASAAAFISTRAQQAWYQHCVLKTSVDLLL
jgi:hypothetical protein